MATSAYYLNVVVITTFPEIADLYIGLLQYDLPHGARGITCMKWCVTDRGGDQVDRLMAQIAAMGNMHDRIEIVIVVGEMKVDGEFWDDPGYWMRKERLSPRFLYGWLDHPLLVTNRCQPTTTSRPLDLMACLNRQAAAGELASRHIWGALTDELTIRRRRDGVESLGSWNLLISRSYDDEEESADELPLPGYVPHTDDEVHTEPEI
jgi:hypothetical protein